MSPHFLMKYKTNDGVTHSEAVGFIELSHIIQIAELKYGELKEPGFSEVKIKFKLSWYHSLDDYVNRSERIEPPAGLNNDPIVIENNDEPLTTEQRYFVGLSPKEGLLAMLEFLKEREITLGDAKIINISS